MCVCACVCVCMYVHGLKSIKSLNIIQLEVLPAIYYSNENLLVSAPASVGKTNIPRLMVLREQWNNLEGGVIH